MILQKVETYLTTKNIIIVRYDNLGNEIKEKEVIIKDITQFLKDWMDYDSVIKSGVYMIGDFYIGQSSNIRKRLLRHIKPSIFKYQVRVNPELSKKLDFYIDNCLQIPVTILSKKNKLEGYYIEKYQKLNYPLINKAYGIGPKFSLEVI